MQDDKEVFAFTLKNSNGMEVNIIEYGAIVEKIITPDGNGNFADVVLGYDSLSGYQNDPYYFGGTIGRVANRIGGAKVTIDGTDYKLAPNTLPDFGFNSLHGGYKGFNKVLWKGEEFKNENELGIVMEATTDKNTFVNMTHHS
jgi:aldose 1-epimerase